MTEAELDDLLLRYADGQLEAQQLARLEAELQQCGAARLRMRELAEHAFAVGEAGRCREARRSSWGREEAEVSEHFSWRPMLALAASVAAAVGLLLFTELPGRKPLLEVIAVRGSAVWSEGDKRVPLVAGARLSSGTIEVESETATAEVRLADGTHFTLNGCAEAVFSDREGKQVVLKRGKVTASVAPQSPGHPLRMLTPEANLEVLGTIFSLEAAPQRTNLRVAQGRVRLRRLVDGREVEVGADQHVAASLASSDALLPLDRQTPPFSWSLPLDTEPEEFSGHWIDTAGSEPARIAGVPLFERRMEDGSVLVHHGVIVRSNASHDAFASIGDDTVLRVRLRMKSEFPVQMMISTLRPDGAFAGNFELVRRHPQGDARREWQTIEVPIREFIPNHPERVNVAAGNQISAVILTTMHEPVGLEIAEVSILPTSFTR